MTALIIFGAKYLIALPPLALLVYVYRHEERRKKLFFLALLSLPLTYVVGKMASMFWYDPLPFVEGNFAPLIAHAADNGFPSDHMLFAASLAMVAWYHNRALGTFLWIVALLIGVARVLAGVHHIVDLLAAALIAIIVTTLAHLALRETPSPQQLD